MSSKSNDQGRAFEYACIIELKDRIEDKRPVTIDDESVMAARRAIQKSRHIFVLPMRLLILCFQPNRLFLNVTEMMI
ncbi:MAG: hypothetical protein ACI4JW_05460 [Oscillospiraceae bacterium]